jgi:hypothetical protein
MGWTRSTRSPIRCGARLDTWGTSEYSVETVGYNTITVSLRTSGNDDTVYSYLEQYLGFSGGDIEVDAAYKTVTDPYPIIPTTT